ncbi:MAG TPA: non-heme iron oxygenase ferredoxin subunit [candidate division Zixibacteria bacterium]|nr:non-heme iron oxygenase ferredoxin subunit [candidate division Zixibacteria bacterium]
MTGQFVKVCSLDDIEERRTRAVEIDGRTILLARLNGHVYALQNMCTHDGGVLGEADIVEREIECPRHGARFNVTTGEATRMPAVAELETFEVKIENGNILVAVNW